MMKSKILLIGWLKTLFCSYIISLIAGTIFAYIEMHGENLSHSISIVAWGALYLHVILFIMSMLSLFLTVPSFFINLLMRYMLYFGGSIMFVIALLVSHLKDIDKTFYLIVTAIFILVSIFFYKKTINTLKSY